MSALLDSLLTADELKTARAADPADIGLTIAGEDAAAHARFVSLAGQDSRTARLMVQCAELRSELAAKEEALADATSLTYSYAKLIGQHREPQGIVSLIRRLDSQRLTTEELRAIIAALTLKTDDMPYDMSSVADSLQDAHDLCASVPDLPDDREVAEDERQDTLRTERKDGVR